MFDQERATRLIASGASLRQTAKQLGCSASHICETAALDPVFGEQYARAMAIRHEHDVEQLAEIKQKVLDGTITPEQGRVAGDLIKWPAARRAQHLFGDRVKVDAEVRHFVIEDPTRNVRAALLPKPVPALDHAK